MQEFIVFWYDEYLTPGEGFNEAIQEALNQSRLFVMVVTPNLVNEQNYVMTTENPTARKAGKIIVPIQAIPTDRAALESSFEGIPPCVDKADRQRLAQVLAEKMQGILRSEAASSAKHDFYIGMAYLNGVNVEVNHAWHSA